MQRIVLVLATTVTGVVLLFSYRTSTGGLPPVADAAGAGIVSRSPSTATAAPDSADPSATTPTDPAADAGTVVVDGSTAETRWGVVQVQITVTDGVVTAATTIAVPDWNGRDRQINDRAVPVLNAETVEADGADIDTVSGATVTSNGYIESLQAALDVVRGGR